MVIQSALSVRILHIQSQRTASRKTLHTCSEWRNRKKRKKYFYSFHEDVHIQRVMKYLKRYALERSTIETESLEWHQRGKIRCSFSRIRYPFWKESPQDICECNCWYWITQHNLGSYCPYKKTRISRMAHKPV